MLLCSALCVFISACHQSLPETVPVEGSVKFAGEPLSSGVVTFHPHEIAEGLPRRPAKGHLDAQGRFQLSTFRPGDGAVPGTYRVTVHSYLNRPDKLDDAAVYEPQWRIPQRYGDPAASQLSAAVSAQEPSVEISLELDE